MKYSQLKYFVLLFLLIFAASNLLSQNKADSLKIRIETEKDADAKVQYLIELSTELLKNERLPTGINLLQQGIGNQSEQTTILRTIQS